VITVAELIGAVSLLILAWATHGLGGALLAALALFAAWVVSRLFWPYKPCPRCDGTGRNPGSNERRHGDCRRCKGARRVRRFGAGHVHRAKIAILNRTRKES
jgi:hypothetical protein